MNAQGAAPIRVAIVEDQRRTREGLGELVSGADGLCLHGAFGSMEEALPALRGDPPDVLLADIGLPGMSGTEGVRLLKVEHPRLAVLMLSVHGDDEHVFGAICAGASGYLLKSASREEILQGIDAVLAGGGAMDAQIARRVLEMFARMGSPHADYGLSERERQILGCLVDGLTKGVIADRLELSPHTIDGHVRNIYMKLHVHNRSGAVAKALRENLL
jgi:DNA-binding NarL/FixJ family response regulator